MTADTVGGVWTYAIELCRELGRFGVEVVLATMGAPLSNHRRALLGTLGNVIVQESDYELEWMTDAWPDVDRAGRWLLELESMYQPDIIHLNNYAHGNLPWRTPTVVIGHSCVYSWFSAVRQGRPEAEWNTYRERVLGGLSAAAWIVAPSAAMLEELQRHYGPFRGSRMSVVHNGMGAIWMRPDQVKQNIVVSAGRVWDEAKNMGMLDRIAPRLSWPVHIAGDPRHPDGTVTSLSAAVTHGNLSRRALIALLRRASIYVSPALYEPFGLGTLEAALCGCALVLSDIPSSREIWGSAAMYADPHDESAFVDALRKLIANPAMRAQYGRRARGHALKYPSSTMAARYVEIYREVWQHRRKESIMRDNDRSDSIAAPAPAQSKRLVRV